MCPEETKNTIEKALKLLDLFTADKPRWRLSEMAREVEIPKPTVYRWLSALERAGFVAQDPKTKSYTLGYKLIELGNTARDQIDLAAVALPYMEQLRDRCGESVHLTVVINGEGVYLEKVDTDHPIRLWTRLSDRGPLHAGASRTILMAYLPEEEIDRIIARGLKKFTDKTVTNPEKLKEKLRRIRQQGWAVSKGEVFSDSASIAAPIYNDKGEVIAGISVGGPINRFTEERIKEILPMVVETAGLISRNLGYNPERRQDFLAAN